MCSVPSQQAINISDRAYFQAAQKTSGIVVGSYTEGRVTGGAGLPIALALDGDSAWSGGVAIAALDLGWLGDRLRERELAKNGALTIADGAGRILAREPMPEQFVGTLIPDAFQHLVRAASPGSMELTSQDGTHRVIGYYPASDFTNGLYISAGLSTADAYVDIDRASFRGALIALAGIAVALAIARSTTQAFVSAPFRRIVGTLDAWRRNDLSARTRMTAKSGEMGRVGQAVDDFMDELVANRARQAQSDRQRDLLQQELDHRVKNLLATVGVVARQSFRGSSAGDEVRKFTERLQAMGSAHGLLMQERWQSASIRELVETAIAPFLNPARPQFIVEGPDWVVEARIAVSLAMAIHELCTNAAKYGALSTDRGQVDIAWEITGEADTRALTLVWTEFGRPGCGPSDRPRLRLADDRGGPGQPNLGHRAHGFPPYGRDLQHEHLHRGEC